MKLRTRLQLTAAAALVCTFAACHREHDTYTNERVIYVPEHDRDHDGDWDRDHDRGRGHDRDHDHDHDHD